MPSAPKAIHLPTWHLLGWYILLPLNRFYLISEIRLWVVRLSILSFTEAKTTPLKRKKLWEMGRSQSSFRRVVISLSLFVFPIFSSSPLEILQINKLKLTASKSNIKGKHTNLFNINFAWHGGLSSKREGERHWTQRIVLTCKLFSKTLKPG